MDKTELRQAYLNKIAETQDKRAKIEARFAELDKQGSENLPALVILNRSSLHYWNLETELWRTLWSI